MPGAVKGPPPNECSYTMYNKLKLQTHHNMLREYLSAVFCLSVVKLKPNLLLTTQMTQPISKTK